MNQNISDRQFLPKTIPPPIEPLGKPEKDSEKHGTNDKDLDTIQDELQPTKPFYYVVPPGLPFLYYNPQIQLV